jgi:glucosamine-6-phosphate deaminase
MVSGEEVRQLRVDRLPIRVFRSNQALGLVAALDARRILQEALEVRGEANLVLATGNSQLSFLHALRELEGIAWERIRVFHMDEYVGIEPNHPASFPLFLRKHILDAVKPREFFAIPSLPADIGQACLEYEQYLRKYPSDLTALGWGENGHLAFNDPPDARFDDPVWVKVVRLDERSRRQQVGEGHFPDLAAVPTEAITMTIPALLAAKNIFAIVPEARKAEAVAACLLKPVSADRPGSILRQVENAQLYLDTDSAEQFLEEM